MTNLVKNGCMLATSQSKIDNLYPFSRFANRIRRAVSEIKICKLDIIAVDYFHKFQASSCLILFYCLMNEPLYLRWYKSVYTISYHPIRPLLVTCSSLLPGLGKYKFGCMYVFLWISIVRCKPELLLQPNACNAACINFICTIRSTMYLSQYRYHAYFNTACHDKYCEILLLKALADPYMPP